MEEEEEEEKEERNMGVRREIFDRRRRRRWWGGEGKGVGLQYEWKREKKNEYGRERDGRECKDI